MKTGKANDDDLLEMDLLIAVTKDFG